MPSLSLVTRQPVQSLPIIPLNTAASRLHYAIKHLLRIIASREKPIILFLDDLQWADHDSLTVLREILADYEQRYLLVLGTFRSDTAMSSSTFNDWLMDLKRLDVHSVHIELGPLDSDTVQELLLNSGFRNDSNLQKLANRITRICTGNPLHIHRYLMELHEYGLLSWDSNRMEWLYVAHPMSTPNDYDQHNFDQLLHNQLEKLPEKTRVVLDRAACLGSKLSLPLISRATCIPEDEIYEGTATGY